MGGDVDQLSGARSSAGRAAEFAPYAVFIISNVRLYQDGLVHCLSLDSTVRVVGSGTPQRALQQLGALDADVVVVDTKSVTDIDIARRLIERAPRAKILAFGMSDSDVDAGWMEAGISAYVPPEASREDLLRAIYQSAQGIFACSPEMTAVLFKRLAGRSDQGQVSEPALALTAREQDVLILLERGLSNKEIARKLFIGSATVKNHVHSILNKLHLHRRSEVPSRLRTMRQVGSTHPVKAAVSAAS